jgi:hypothetical protein
MAVTFQPDLQVAEVAEAYSLDAVDMASRAFGIALNWSDESVQKVEEILGRLHDDILRAQPPDDAVWTFAKAFGSYVGEVLRRHHSGEWGMVRMGDESFPGVQQPGGKVCWPWGRAHKRIVDGPENNIWHYYQHLIVGST